MNEYALNVRLCSAAEFVRQDAVFADIGTDHAYLPIFLLKKGIIRTAVCADINKGPLERAKENSRLNGVADKISFYLTDGASELSGLGITDYAICGMGGELIAKIISEAPGLKEKGVNLILQPMTRQSTLRRYLAAEGFSVQKESYTSEGTHHYVCMLASYTANKETIDAIEAEIGFKNAEIVNKDLQIAYLKSKLHAYDKLIEGKKNGGNSTADEEKIREAIASYINTAGICGGTEIE